MAKVELKRPIVEEISANLKDAAGVVLVDHCGLTVEQDTQLRRLMRAEGIIYKVYKNTMLNFAIKGTEFEPLAQHLEGPSAVAISKTDATAPAIHGQSDCKLCKDGRQAGDQSRCCRGQLL